MQAFHNDPNIKAAYIQRVQAHRAADELVQGTGWGRGKGCAVGCTLEADAADAAARKNARVIHWKACADKLVELMGAA